MTDARLNKSVRTAPRVKPIAWALLAMMLAVVTASALHVHHVPATSTTECHDCAAMHHEGHLSVPTIQQADCTLCEFLSSPFRPGEQLRAVIATGFCELIAVLPCSSLISGFTASLHTRAPPAA